LGPTLAQIKGEGFPHIRRQRQSILLMSFSSDSQFAIAPVNIVQRHVYNFTGSQTETSEKQKDRVVTLVSNPSLVARRKEAIHFFRFEILRYRRLSPVRH
jgi:hypothetical protein